MYLQEILEVAIGLVFVWLVMSVATMSLQEWFGNILNMRARELEKAIIQMLNSEELSRQFYNHPLITNLYRPSKTPGKKGRLPSYIPSAKFSAAVFSMVVQAGTDYSPVRMMTSQINQQLASIKSPEQQKLSKADWNAILETARNLAASGLGSAALDSLKLQLQIYGDKYPEAKPGVDALIPQVDTYYGQFVQEQRLAVEAGADAGLPLRQLRLGLLGLQKVNPRLSASISAIIKQAEGYTQRADQAVAAARTNLETWFNDSMTRLSGTYKRRAQLNAFIIGLVLALLLNVDSVNVATSLWREPTLRQAIIAQAQSYTLPAASQGSSTPGASTNAALQDIPQLQTQLQALNIPFGWVFTAFDTSKRQCSLLPLQAGQVWGVPSVNSQGQAVCKGLSDLPPDLISWLVKIMGLLMTGLATTQGAPFWFDVLGKLVNVRGTGPNPSQQQPVG
ncbi:MAG TPA: hypothetical protein VMT91_12610 [Anaerolineales bacterium]|nr:hypothetical protein [Anaerolineales bacterium]